MLKKISSYCLCFVLAFPHVIHAGTVQQNNIYQLDKQAIIKQYPTAKILEVAPEDYPQLAKQLRSQGYNQALPQHEVNDGSTTQSIQNQATNKTSDNCDNNSTSVGEDSINVMLDISGDVLNSASGGNGDGAALVFVIVGTVLVVVWALYVFKFLYDVATGFKPCYWSELTLSSSRISSNSDDYADFKGINYMTGFRNGATEVGISIELGHSDIQLPQLLNQRLKGSYLFLGPLLRWRMSASKNPHYFSMNFLAGSTEHDEMGTIAKASLGLQFGLGTSTHLGFSWGAMSIDVKDSQGILQDRNEYFYLYGMNFGFKF